MKAYQNKPIDGVPSFPKPLTEIAAEVPPDGALVVWTLAEFITNQQIRWFKGILLKHLANDSGYTVGYWERKILKAHAPELVEIDVDEYGNKDTFVRSINNLSKKRMSELIEGAVELAHDEGFTWVTLPDATLRRT